MRFSLSTLAALAGVSQAFLIPSTMSVDDKDIVSALPYEAAAMMDGRIIQIDCPGCPLQANAEGEESVLQLNFTISHDNGDHLEVNGVQIYPMDPTSTSFMTPLTADQFVRGSVSNIWQYASTVKLGYGLSVRSSGRRGSDTPDDGMGLVVIHFEVVEVADQFFSDLPSIELKLVETPSGKLMIGDAEVSNPESSDSSAQECTTMLCKWKAIIADRIAKLKAMAAAKAGKSGKGCGSKSRPTPDAAGGARPHGHGRPRPHGPHRTHRKHGSFGRVLRGIVLHIFLPIMIGVVVGITASIVGMVVGHVVIFVWRLLFRRGEQTRYTRIQQDVIVVETDDEIKSFLDHQGPPPVYEEALDEKATQ